MKNVYEEFQKKAIISRLQLKKYISIIEKVKDEKCDLKSEEFTKEFTCFFKVRRNNKWRSEYYEYFNEARKNKDIKIDNILKNMPNGKIELSFASKMLASINPDMPIWDKKVKKYFEDRIDVNYKSEADAIEVYENLVKEFNIELKKPEIKEAVKRFKVDFDNYHLSDTKILDFIIWIN